MLTDDRFLGASPSVIFVYSTSTGLAGRYINVCDWSRPVSGMCSQTPGGQTALQPRAIRDREKIGSTADCTATCKETLHEYNLAVLYILRRGPWRAPQGFHQRRMLTQERGEGARGPRGTNQEVRCLASCKQAGRQAGR